MNDALSCQTLPVSSTRNPTYGGEISAPVQSDHTDAELRAALAAHVGRNWHIERLLSLVTKWRAGESPVDIAASIGVSRNAAGGKASRLVAAGLLVSRGLKNGGWREGGRVAKDPAAGAAAAAFARAQSMRRSRPVTPPTPLPPPVRLGRVRECCWPIGEPGSREFRYCAAPIETRGASYCEDHALSSRIDSRGHAAPLAGSGAVLAGDGP